MIIDNENLLKECKKPEDELTAGVAFAFLAIWAVCVIFYIKYSSIAWTALENHYEGVGKALIEVMGFAEFGIWVISIQVLFPAITIASLVSFFKWVFNKEEEVLDES